jgi:phage terminase small subunit
MRYLPLSPMQAAFAIQYARNGGNGRQAAIAAGYSPRSAAVLAHRLTRRPAVREEIDRHGARLLAFTAQQTRPSIASRARALLAGLE